MSQAAQDITSWSTPRCWLADPFEHLRTPAAPLRAPKAALLASTGLSWVSFR